MRLYGVLCNVCSVARRGMNGWTLWTICWLASACAWSMSEVMRSAVHGCRSSGVGFVDALIAPLANAAWCGQTLSFDGVAVRFAGILTV
jgi:hypothetical protein